MGSFEVHGCPVRYFLKILTHFSLQVVILALLTAISVATPRPRDAGRGKYRLLPFAALAVSALIQASHAAVLFPLDHLRRYAGLDLCFLEVALMLIGTLFLLVRLGLWSILPTNGI